jgi:hypothetical protein
VYDLGSDGLFVWARFGKARTRASLAVEQARLLLPESPLVADLLPPESEMNRKRLSKMETRMSR